ncbi:MAG: PhoX family phosphatase [Actinomycetota bacterium]|nr:PhoX family phosphatase [Actinomycetota bacterium]
MFDTDDIPSNPTDNPHLGDMIASRVSRRSLLGGALAATVVGLAGSGAFGGTAAAASDDHRGNDYDDHDDHHDDHGPLLGFTGIEPSTDDTVRVPEGYTWDVLIPWGTPLFNGVTWQEDASNTAADQAKQVGFNHDGMKYFPLPAGRRNRNRGLLVVNHEYTDASQIYTAAQGSTITPDAAGQEKVAKALAGHGVTVVEIAQLSDGSWTHVVGSKYNRRITGTTPVTFSGPVPASHAMLASTVSPTPRGTLNNCANGFTPWGTYLTCEENWNGYFGTDAAFTATPLEARYGVSKAGFGYNWHKAEPRFDLQVNRNELNHFGWVVEIDPFSPNSTPVKRTALGRIKHEGATVVEARGKVVVYTGDDENGDYVYKFVGDRPWREHRARRRSPLDHGTLYVAQFDAVGNGTWLPLVHGAGVLTVANGWADQADVLIRTRQAADAVGATRCHRPEWITVDHETRDVYVAFTNGSGNNAAVNSLRDPNPYGHIVRIMEAGANNAALTFSWDIYVAAGDPAYDATLPATQTIFGSPDGLWMDDDRRLWIQTDISNSSQNLASRFYDHIGNNQMLVSDPDTGEIRRFLTGPRGCELTGITVTPDQRTMFVNIQHPGESTTYWNTLNGGAPTVSNPSAVSSWPYGAGHRPRPATVVIRKLDGGKIGS